MNNIFTNIDEIREKMKKNKKFKETLWKKNVKKV